MRSKQAPRAKQWLPGLHMLAECCQHMVRVGVLPEPIAYVRAAPTLSSLVPLLGSSI